MYVQSYRTLKRKDTDQTTSHSLFKIYQCSHNNTQATTTIGHTKSSEEQPVIGERFFCQRKYAYRKIVKLFINSFHLKKARLPANNSPPSRFVPELFPWEPQRYGQQHDSRLNCYHLAKRPLISGPLNPRYNPIWEAKRKRIFQPTNH